MDNSGFNEPRRLLLSAWGTISEMLDDRGYLMPEGDEIGSDDAIITRMESKGTIASFKLDPDPIVPHPRGPDGKTLRSPSLIIVMGPDKIGVDNIREFIAMYKEQEPKVEHVMLITQNKPTHTVYSTLFARGMERPTFEIFQLSELARNKTDHHIIDPHRVLDNAERVRILSRYARVNATQLWNISDTDFMPRYLGVAIQLGTIIEITRRNGLGQPQKVWRIVTHTPEKK